MSHLLLVDKTGVRGKNLQRAELIDKCDYITLC